MALASVFEYLVSRWLQPPVVTRLDFEFLTEKPVVTTGYKILTTKCAMGYTKSAEIIWFFIRNQVFHRKKD